MKRTAGGASTPHHRAIQWIASNPSGLSVNRGVDAEVFRPVARDYFNLISIFGAARQGKSFLMNCVAGSQRNIFKVSNNAQPCTQGIDISSYSMDLQDFSNSIGSAKRRHKMRVGFVDAEGQGDRDVTYDAKLVCPILLASKCVIFNWKNAVQKENILQLLGIMQRAAYNVSVEEDSIAGSTDGSTRVFGHLHIVFRDWNFEGGEEKVRETIFKEERGADTAIALRNQIRRDVQANFQSIRIWLFPAPTDDVASMREELTFDRVSSSFRAKVVELRQAMAEQLAEPTLFAGSPLRAQDLPRMMSTIVDTLNSGKTLQPEAAYISMMKAEADAKKDEFERSLHAAVELLIQNLGDEVDSHGSICSKQEALVRLNSVIENAEQEYNASLDEAFGSLGGELRIRVLGKSSQADILKAKETVSKYFSSAFQGLFQKWLRPARQRAEREIDAAVQKLESEAAAVFPWETDVLERRLKDIFDKAIKAISEKLSGVPCSDDSEDIKDAIEQLRKHAKHSFDGIRRLNTQMESEKGSKVQECLKKALGKIEAHVNSVKRSLRASSTPQKFELIAASLNAVFEDTSESMARDIARLMSTSPNLAKIQAELNANLVEECRVMDSQLIQVYKEVLPEIAENVRKDALLRLGKVTYYKLAYGSEERRHLLLSESTNLPKPISDSELERRLESQTQEIFQIVLAACNLWSFDLVHDTSDNLSDTVHLPIRKAFDRWKDSIRVAHRQLQREVKEAEEKLDQQRRQDEAERELKRIADEKRRKEVAEREQKRIAEEQRRKEVAEREQKRIAEEQRRKEEAEMEEKRLFDEQKRKLVEEARKGPENDLHRKKQKVEEKEYDEDDMSTEAQQYRGRLYRDFLRKQKEERKKKAEEEKNKKSAKSSPSGSLDEATESARRVVAARTEQVAKELQAAGAKRKSTGGKR